MKFEAGDYFRVAQERYKDAVSLYRSAGRDEASYGVSLYISGLAIECLVRAFRAEMALPFDDKHDLMKLFTPKVMETISSAENRRQFSIAVNKAYAIWLNQYRYASERQLELVLKKKYQGQKIKGSNLKYACLSMQDAMKVIFKDGSKKWKSLKK